MKNLGKYKLLEELGREDFTTHYQAVDTQSGREVVLKVLSDPNQQRSESSKGFLESAKIVTNLHHPCIAKIYDFGDDDGTFYLAMQIPHGRTLRQLLEQHKRFTLEQALPILIQLAEALDYVEERGLVYKALDPVDVILESEDGFPSVTITSFCEAREEVYGNEKSFLPHVVVLAALVFEMLSGHPSSNVELLTRVSSRYSSAGALVAELQTVNDRIIEQNQQISEVMQVLAEAQNVSSPDDWLKVQALALQAMQHSHKDAELLGRLVDAAGAIYRVRTTEAKRLQLADLYGEGERALQDKDWQSAVTAFEKVARADPKYHEVLDKLAQAKAELGRAKLYDQAVKQGEAGEQIQASRSWLALLTEQWNYRQGEAVQQFMDVVEKLLDQLDEGYSSRPEELLDSERKSSVIAQSFLDRYPNKSTLAKEWLDELVKQKTEWLEPLPGREMEKISQGSETLAQAAGNPNMDELENKKTEKLHWQPEQAPATMAESSKSQVQIDNWVDEQVTKLTERFGEEPILKAEKEPKASEDPARTGARFDTLTTGRTERLEDHLDPASAHQQQDLNNCSPSQEHEEKEMIRIPAGEFLYGKERKLIHLDEFWIDKAPVTNAEYKRFLDAHPDYPVPCPYFDSYEDKPYKWDREARTFAQGMDDHPVVLVTIEDVRAYAKWVGKRLPIEQEWEKAARGTDGRTYPWGSTWQMSVCNTKETGIGGTTPVGEFSPDGDSPFGCVDMSGNVWEWTASNFSERTMVVRGGSWRNGQLDAWCVTRAGNLSSTVKISIGFRLVK